MSQQVHKCIRSTLYYAVYAYVYVYEYVHQYVPLRTPNGCRHAYIMSPSLSPTIISDALNTILPQATCSHAQWGGDSIAAKDELFTLWAYPPLGGSATGGG